MLSERILVTGGAGFIGSELTRQLAAAGHEVLVVDNLVNGKRENVADVLDERVRLIVADVRDEGRMRELLSCVHRVYHLACLGVRHSIHSPIENHAVNADATLRLLMAARAAGVGRFVHVSTSEVYGTAREAPMTEDHPTFPLTVYGASKLAGECYARAFHATHGFSTVIVRPFNSYGPRSHHEGDCGEVIPRFMLRAMAGLPLVVFGDGAQTRDFTFVADTARAILAAGFVDEAVGRTINVGSGRETAINELATTIGDVVQSAVEVRHEDDRPGDVLRLCADASLARALLGFAPSVSLAEGLQHLRAWYETQGVRPEALLQSEVLHNWEAPTGAFAL